MGTPGYATTREGPRRGLAITSLALGILSLLTAGCLGVGALIGLVLGIVALMKVGSDPREYGGKGMAIAGIMLNAAGLLLTVVVGIIAAIAIPSLLRARVSANEASAIGDVRSVISAQAVYQSLNGGYYDGRMACLATPTECSPSAAADTPPLLDTTLTSLATKSGYKRELRAGAAIDRTQLDSDLRDRVSPSSVSAYAYLALPATRGQTGVRAFCGDSNGVVCFTPDGSEPQIAEDGTCDLSTCQPVQ